MTLSLVPKPRCGGIPYLNHVRHLRFYVCLFHFQVFTVHGHYADVLVSMMEEIGCQNSGSLRGALQNGSIQKVRPHINRIEEFIQVRKAHCSVS